MTRRTRSASPIFSVADSASAATGAASRPRPPRLPLSAGTVLAALLATYLAATALWPLLRLFLEALGPGENGHALGILREQWQGRAAPRALRNTLEASLLATLLSTALGVAFAAAVSLTDIRLKSLVVFALMLPLLVPSQVTALAWIGLTGPSSPILDRLGLAPAPGATNPLYSKWGIVLVMGVEHAGLVFLAVRAALADLPRDIVEAARLGGAGSIRILRSILLPLAFPAIIAGAALAFVASIGNFGVPAFLGIPGRYTMLTTLIYQRLQSFGPSVLGEVAGLALVLTLLTALGLILRAAVSGRVRSAVERSSAPMQPMALGRWRLSAEIVLWLVLIAIAILPLFALLGTALVPALGVPLGTDTATLRNFGFVLFAYDAAARAFRNSFLLAATAAFVCSSVALCLAYLAVLAKNRAARMLDLVADAPYAVPGTVLGIAIVLVYLQPLPILGFSIYNTFWILVIAYLARFLVLALRPAVAGMEVLDPAIDEAARVAGAGLGLRLRSIVLPGVAPALGAGAVLIFMQAFNELTVSALLWSSGWETLGVMIFFLQREGNSVAAAALATIVLTATLLIALGASLFAHRLPKGMLPWQV